MKMREERKSLLEQLNLTEETINTILDAEDDPSTLYDWADLKEMLETDEEC